MQRCEFRLAIMCMLRTCACRFLSSMHDVPPLGRVGLGPCFLLPDSGLDTCYCFLVGTALACFKLDCNFVELVSFQATVSDVNISPRPSKSSKEVHSW